MNRDRVTFRDQSLGSWSSHPAFLVRRTRLWTLLGLAPLALGLLLFLGAWRFGGVSLLDLAKSWSTWLPWMLGLLVFGFSAGVTILMVARASTIPAIQSASTGQSKFKFWAFALGVTLVSGGAFAATRGDFLRSVIDPESIGRLRLVGHLVGTLPVLILLIWLEFGGSAVDEWGQPAPRMTKPQLRRRVGMLFAIFFGYLLTALWIDRVASALDLYLAYLQDPQTYSKDSVVAEIARWIPGLADVMTDPAAGGGAIDFLRDVERSIAAIALLVPLVGMTCFVGVSALAFLSQAKTVREPIDADAIARAEGYDLRPTGESWDANAGREQRPTAQRWRTIEEPGDKQDSKPVEDADGSELGEEESAADGPPDWLDKIREQVGAKHPLEWSSLRRAESVESSPISDRADLTHLFATAVDPDTGISTPPTRDQVDALEKFDSVFQQFLEAEDREGQCVFPSTDLLVTGPPGSGRTTLLLATALHTVVLRGQSVLILTPTVEKAALYVKRLRELAARGGVGWHVAVGQISKNDVRSWADALDKQPAAQDASKPHRSPVGSLPDILIGTPHDYEQCFYGLDYGHACLRRSLLRLQVVLIEDVSTFRKEERRHLPFLIDKHRLVLASEYLPTQFLALAPQLTEIAANYLTERLFSERARVPKVRLRPPVRPAPWLVDVSAEDPTAVVEAIAAACATEELHVVLWRPVASKEDSARLGARLGQAASRVQVVADLDELSAEDGANADIAVYRSHTARQQTLALSSHVAGAETVLVRVTRPGALNPLPEAERALPVLPSVGSDSFVVAHLQSAFKFLAPFSPAPRDVFARMGLRPTGQLQGLARPERSFKTLPQVYLRLDPPEDVAEPVAAARSQTWAWVALHVEGWERNRVPQPRPVEMFRPMPRGSQLRGDAAEDRVFLGNAEVDEQVLASWFTQQNELLDRMDLSFSDDLMHRHGEQEFVPREIVSSSDGLHVKGEPFRDKDQGERYLPVFDVALTVKENARVEGDQGGVAPKVLRWYSVREEPLGASTADARFWLSGSYDVTGGIQRLSPPAPLHYDVRFSALLLGRERVADGMTQSQREEATRKAFLGSWDTRRSQHETAADLRPWPWPALGLALTAGLREVMPGLFDYCRLVAHRGPTDGVNDDRAFLLFVEPAATRGTVGDAMRKLLMDDELLLNALEAARDRLDAVDPTDEDTLANLLVDARILIGDGWYDDHKAGEQVLTADTADALALLDETIAELRLKSDRSERLRRKRLAARGEAPPPPDAAS